MCFTCASIAVACFSPEALSRVAIPRTCEPDANDADAGIQDETLNPKPGIQDETLG